MYNIYANDCHGHNAVRLVGHRLEEMCNGALRANGCDGHSTVEVVTKPERQTRPDWESPSVYCDASTI